MKFINKTKNTVFLEDIDLEIPFLEDYSPQDIDLDLVKRSLAFRQLVALTLFEIVESNDSLFERNLNKIQKEAIKINNSNESNLIKPPTDALDMSKTSSNIEVRLRGHFFEAGGYAKANRNIVNGLSSLGIDVEIDPVAKNSSQITEEEIRKLNSYTKKVSRNAISIDSLVPSMNQIGNGKYKVLFTTIESASIPKQFIDICNQYNEIWVVSDFCKEVLEKYNISKEIFVIPNSIDCNLYKEDVKPYQFSPELNNFVFLSVFNWSYRKGYDLLLKSYLSEFTGNDDVSLLLLTRNGFMGGQNKVIIDTIKEYKDKYNNTNPPHIALCSNIISEKEMPSLYKACNAYVLFSRGEGSGLPYQEASLCGLPIIGTNFSGHTMFLKKDNSNLIDIDDLIVMPSGKMGVHYWDNQLFPSLTSSRVLEDSKNIMRYVFNNEKECIEKNNKLKSHILTNYSIESVAKRIKERLEIIWKKIS